MTGSMDRTAKLFDVPTGVLISVFIITLIITLLYITLYTIYNTIFYTQYNFFRIKNTKQLTRNSVNNFLFIPPISLGQEIGTLNGHTGEVIAANFDHNGNQLITGSFDSTVNVWDTRTCK